MKRRVFKDLSELTLMDDYMFGVVMQDPKIAKKLIEQILKVRITRIKYVEPQRTIKKRYGGKGIRLDLYVEDENGNIYNVEIQTSNHHNLPKRMRYYQAIIDMHILSPGANYKALRRSYVIFICNYDPFGLGRCVYTFENRCVEALDVAFGDETTKVVVNTAGMQEDLSEELKDILRYLDRGVVEGESSQMLEEAVNAVKSNEERRREYMVMMAREQEIRDEGREEGLEEGLTKGRAEGLTKGREEGLEEGLTKGRAEGREQGASLLGRLITRLMSQGRMQDVERAASDAAYRRQLYVEFGLE